MIKIYTDGACSVNPGIGGWGAIIIFESGEEKKYLDQKLKPLIIEWRLLL